ncbi:MAG: DUF1343 domain-containing protein [Armatimonadota bacterium]|nr:DUF1343 domain-containing protein [Armatimonadota bacterium]
MATAALRTLQARRAHTRGILAAAAVLLVLGGGPPAASAPRPQVWPGVDVLVAHYTPLLAGKRVGLITHRAATGLGGWPTATILTLDPRIRVVALFAPEHGLAGTLQAGEAVPFLRAATGARTLPVYSLYAGRRRPSPEMLAGVDALVVDLQDVGARAYTYTSTMALAMQAAAEYGKTVVVLDRPNPLGGDRVDGPVLDPDFASFIGIYPLPAVHGMTIGELALLFNQEFGVGARLAVVPMSGWRGRMHWEDTGLSWSRPSPNLPSPVAAQLHAATGLLEGTTLAVGAGTTTPFQTVTARWLRGDLLAGHLNRRGLPGVRFEAVTVGAPERRQSGVRLVLTDRRRFRPAATAVHILDAVHRLHPRAPLFTPPQGGGRYRFDLVWGTDAVRKAILRGERADWIVAGWQADLQWFVTIRQRYLLYPRGTPYIPR